MNNSEIFAARLKNARVMKGFSMDELVSKLGNTISKMTISKYEKCQLAPNSSIIISLAKTLNQPVDYFFRPFTMKIDSIRFRKLKSRLSAKDEKSIKENIADLIERYINIEEVCTASVKFESPFDDEIFSFEQIKKSAILLRKKWNIGTDGIVNVIDLLEEHGIKVLEIEAPESFDGLSSLVNNLYPVIVLNKNFQSERKRFTVLHELSHLIFSFAKSVNENEEEKLCNLFASEMLILESVFKKLFGESRHDISYQELKSIQMQYGISCDALMYKAKSCGYISEQRYKTYCIQKNRNREFKNLVEKSIYPEEESTRFTRLVYNALSNELITVSKAASLLHQSVEQVREDLVLV
ncbi:MAG: ImmA/IrrE family metallo-endopeptidase [Treponema sp.]|jgi:Zn-dependent peptidase ImmA (M78 family)/DNA-binding XRE family transcriptional regulator|nr:ImmA/IrrE family metallo-endopeptidase [Treponema sp.]